MRCLVSMLVFNLAAALSHASSALTKGKGDSMHRVLMQILCVYETAEAQR
jgi:hypothetical protein